MSAMEWMQDTLLETSRLLGLQAMAALEERDAWLLRFDDETMLELVCDATEARVVIEGPIADVATHAREKIFEILLHYNYLWAETGGTRMALNGMPGQAVMLFELPSDGLTAARLSDVLSNMATSQRAWRQILHAIGTQAADGDIAARDAADIAEQLMRRA